MKIEQYVMAYGVEQDRLRAMLPRGFSSLRPVLRINAEIRDEKNAYIELNTAVEKDGVRGWLNMDAWASVPWERNEKTVTFYTDFLKISFTGVGIEGGCPAEKDNEGTFFASDANFVLRKPEMILSKKEFCDCSFAWSFTANDAKGKSNGKTLPAIPTEVRTVYPKQSCTAQHAAEIPCIQVLGAYLVKFER
ncbi:MAG: hypothetical protein II359_02375 [Clostridia bacterium]|nr:hypothetical protein [Clostridia bacterium]